MEHDAWPSDALAPYVSMASLFVSAKIDAVEFEARFWAEFWALRNMTDADFAVLNELFYVVEDFVADPTIRDPGDVTETELLDGARAFLEACQAR